LLANVIAHAGQLFHERPADPYIKVHPELEQYWAWLPWAALAYRKHRKNPDDVAARNLRFRRLHPFRAHTAKKAGKRDFRETQYPTIWRDIKDKADNHIRGWMTSDWTSFLGGSRSTIRLGIGWYVNYAWLLAKFCSLGAWWYPVVAGARRLGMYAGVRVGRKRRGIGKFKIPLPNLEATGTSLGAYMRAGRDRRDYYAKMFYGDEQRQEHEPEPEPGPGPRVPRKGWGIRHRVRGAWNTPFTFVDRYVSPSDTDSPGGPSAAAPGADPHDTPTASHDAPTVDLGVTTHGPGAAPRSRVPPAPAAAVSDPAPAPAADLRTAPAEWQSLTPQMREAIGREVTALRAIRRSPDATHEFAATNPQFSKAYAKVLKEIEGLSSSAHPDDARHMAHDILTTERIGRHPHTTLLEHGGPTLARLNSLYGIVTAPKGTKLATMKDLARATLDGKPTKIQMGVSFNGVRAAVATQLKSGGGLAL